MQVTGGEAQRDQLSQVYHSDRKRDWKADYGESLGSSDFGEIRIPAGDTEGIKLCRGALKSKEVNIHNKSSKGLGHHERAVPGRR